MHTTSAQTRQIRLIFRTLEAALGPQHWWPAESAFEVVVGAYLTQNTAWTNVERAMANLRRAGLLSVAGIRDASSPELEQLVRPAGYFRQKAERLKRFVNHLDANYGGSLEAMFARPLEPLRQELLGLNGIGPETADSILLYAASREVFVVDAYTQRIFDRHRLGERHDLSERPAERQGKAAGRQGYEQIRSVVEAALAPGDSANSAASEAASDTTGQPHGQSAAGAVEGFRGQAPPAHPPSAASALPRSERARRYNEFHALLVQIGKHYCLKSGPRCQSCPLGPLLPPGARPG